MIDSIRQVCVHNRAIVKPAQPTHRHSFFLSCLDIYWQDLYYNQRLIFYESTCTEDRRRGAAGQEGSDGQAAAVMEQLKSSLALCLVHYYPWCGRLAKGTAPPHRLFIDCCDAGVEFVEASSHLPLSLLAQDGFQMKPLFQELCQLPDHKETSPLLSIQATLFSDGGLALGIAHSHVVADGLSLWNFMVSWGECSRGVPLSLPPLHNRELLAVVNPSPEKATWSLKPQIKAEDIEEEEMGDALIQKDGEHKIRSTGQDSTMNKDKDNSVGVDRKTYGDEDRIVSNKSSTEDKDSSAGVIKENNSNVGTHASAYASAGNNASLGGDKTEPLVQYMFDLPATAIKKLKSEAGNGHTSYEVICAHFWKHLAAARENATIEPTYFYGPINCRTRVTPPLPSSYFGNVLAFDVILSTVGAICRETMCATACRVHDKVAKITEDFLRGFMHWLEIRNNSSAADLFVSSLRGKGLSTSSSPWFPAYQVDYGWGKPGAVRSANVRVDGELVLFGGRPGSMQGDLEICTALPESVLRRLLKDPGFLAKPRTSPLAND